jgi:stearoyl-CoA desaturase (delta-9 desaturase)
VTLPVFRNEIRSAGGQLSRRIRKLLVRQPTLLDATAHRELDAVLARNTALKTVHDFRERLAVLWSGTGQMSNETLLQHLREWIAHAEASGIKVLQDFAASLRGYAVAAA